MTAEICSLKQKEVLGDKNKDMLRFLGEKSNHEWESMYQTQRKQDGNKLFLRMGDSEDNLEDAEQRSEVVER